MNLYERSRNQEVMAVCHYQGLLVDEKVFSHDSVNLCLKIIYLRCMFIRCTQPYSFRGLTLIAFFPEDLGFYTSDS